MAKPKKEYTSQRYCQPQIFHSHYIYRLASIAKLLLDEFLTVRTVSVHVALRNSRAWPRSDSSKKTAKFSIELTVGVERLPVILPLTDQGPEALEAETSM